MEEENEEATEKDTKELEEIYSEARSEFNIIQEAQRSERKQALEDRRFYSIAGAQWEGDLATQFENKPKFEVNKIHLSVMRIINEYRNNRITVDFISKDGANADELADVCDGLYRADEQDSVADEAYDNAFEEGVGGGMGAWRLRADYEDDEDPDDNRQRIWIEPIYDADTCVYFDLNAKRQDKRDATKCYVLISMTPQAYEEEYDDNPSSWPKDTDSEEFDWNPPNVVFVAEYYKVKVAYKTIQIYEDAEGVEERYSEDELEADEELIVKILSRGFFKTGEKKIKTREIRKYIMSGSKIVKDCGVIAGNNIPIIPVYGKRWFIDNIERFMGHVRLAKDSQRLKNMQLSKLGEISALSTVEKPIFVPEQIAGHTVMWSEDNLKDYPYLLINAITDAEGGVIPAGPIAYTKPSTIPPSLAALLAVTEQDLKDLLGNQQAGEKIVSNIAEETVALVQDRLDMQTFIYVSNMAKAMKRSGEVWLGMSRDLYVEDGRKMKTLGSQDEVELIELNTPTMNEDGEVEYKNAMKDAKFKVAVDIGPSSSSKKSATVRSLMGMMGVTTDPITQKVLSAMMMLNMEGEGISEVRGYFRDSLIKMGVIKPTTQEAEDLAEALKNTQPDANETFLRAAAETELSKAAENKADTIKTIAETEKVKAQTVEIAEGIDRDNEEAALKLLAEVDKTDKTVSPQPV